MGFLSGIAADLAVRAGRSYLGSDGFALSRFGGTRTGQFLTRNLGSRSNSGSGWLSEIARDSVGRHVQNRQTTAFNDQQRSRNFSFLRGQGLTPQEAAGAPGPLGGASAFNTLGNNAHVQQERQLSYDAEQRALDRDKDLAIADIQARTTIGAAGISASASRYGADQSFLGTQYSSDRSQSRENLSVRLEENTLRKLADDAGVKLDALHVRHLAGLEGGAEVLEALRSVQNRGRGLVSRESQGIAEAFQDYPIAAGLILSAGGGGMVAGLGKLVGPRAALAAKRAVGRYRRWRQKKRGGGPDGPPPARRGGSRSRRRRGHRDPRQGELFDDADPNLFNLGRSSGGFRPGSNEALWLSRLPPHKRKGAIPPWLRK